MQNTALKDFKDFTEVEHQEFYQSARSCPLIAVTDADSIEASGYTIVIYEGGRASRVKGKVLLTSWQWRQLLKQMVEDGGVEIEIWSQVDLSFLVE